RALQKLERFGVAACGLGGVRLLQQKIDRHCARGFVALKISPALCRVFHRARFSHAARRWASEARVKGGVSYSGAVGGLAASRALSAESRWGARARASTSAS